MDASNGFNFAITFVMDVDVKRDFGKNNDEKAVILEVTIVVSV